MQQQYDDKVVWLLPVPQTSILHTKEYPYCSDLTCPCQENRPIGTPIVRPPYEGKPKGFTLHIPFDIEDADMLSGFLAAQEHSRVNEGDFVPQTDTEFYLFVREMEGEAIGVDATCIRAFNIGWLLGLYAVNEEQLQDQQPDWKTR